MIVVGQEVTSRRELDALRDLMRAYDEHGDIILLYKEMSPMSASAELLFVCYLAHLRAQVRRNISIIRRERSRGAQ